MSNKPLDHMGNPIDVGDTVIYVGAGYTSFERKVVSKINPKTVNLGEKTRWGSHTRRPFTGVIVIQKGETILPATLAMAKGGLNDEADTE